MIRAFPLLLVIAAGTASAQPPDADSRGEIETPDDGEEILVVRPDEMSDAEYLRERGRHCAGRYREQWVLSQLFAIQTNPVGAYNQFRLGMCFPLIRKPGVLFDYTNIEIGLINELSPAFTHLGGYAQITPLSILVFRVEGSGLVYWPLPFPRAGYYPREGYDSGYQPDDLPAGAGRVETGWNLNFITNLRAKVAFNEVWALLLVDILNVGYWDVGDESYYFNLRWDAILAGQDWIIANEALIGIEARLTNDFGMRAGFFDSYRHVPNADYTGHQVGLFLMGWWPRPYPDVWDMSPFVRAGVYVDHAFRTESFSVLAGLVAQYELGGI